MPRSWNERTHKSLQYLPYPPPILYDWNSFLIQLKNIVFCQSKNKTEMVVQQFVNTEVGNSYNNLIKGYRFKQIGSHLWEAEADRSQVLIQLGHLEGPCLNKKS